MSNRILLGIIASLLTLMIAMGINGHQGTETSPDPLQSHTESNDD